MQNQSVDALRDPVRPLFSCLPSDWLPLLLHSVLLSLLHLASGGPMFSSHSDTAPLRDLDLGEGLGPQGKVLKDCALS